VVLVFVLGGAATGTILALRSTSGHRRSLARASFPGYGLSFRFPSGWQREDWCWVGTAAFPLTLLTTSQPARCNPGIEPVNIGTPLPPAQRLGRDGVAAWWIATARPSEAVANARVGGKPARITVKSEPTRRTAKSYVNCVGTGPTQRRLNAQIQSPSSGVGQIQFGAVICGPDFAAGEADVRQMLATVHFAR
jgi:hypothetical protein